MSQALAAYASMPDLQSVAHIECPNGSMLYDQQLHLVRPYYPEGQIGN